MPDRPSSDARHPLLRLVRHRAAPFTIQLSRTEPLRRADALFLALGAVGIAIALAADQPWLAGVAVAPLAAGLHGLSTAATPTRSIRLAANTLASCAGARTRWTVALTRVIDVQPRATGLRVVLDDGSTRVLRSSGLDRDRLRAIARCVQEAGERARKGRRDEQLDRGPRERDRWAYRRAALPPTGATRPAHTGSRGTGRHRARTPTSGGPRCGAGGGGT